MLMIIHIIVHFISQCKKNVDVNLIYSGRAHSSTSTKLSLTIHSSVPYIVQKQETHCHLLHFAA